VTPPPLLLGAALLFWGWQTGFLLVALPLAAGVESLNVACAATAAAFELARRRRAG